MNLFRSLAFIVLLAGGINWLLVGVFSFDFIAALSQEEVGYRSILSRILYLIVGICSLYCIRLLPIVNNSNK